MAADLEPNVGSVVAAFQKGDAVEGGLEAVLAVKGCLCGALQVHVDLAGCHVLVLRSVVSPWGSVYITLKRHNSKSFLRDFSRFFTLFCGLIRRRKG